MTTTFFDINGIMSLSSISSEKDLRPTGKILINPPPSDGRCQCCGKHLSELEPFEEDEEDRDLPFFDLEGEKLVKVWQRWGPQDEEFEKLWDEFGEDGEAEAAFIQKYGEKKREQLQFHMQERLGVEASWLCRDCIGLGEKEYHHRRDERFSRANPETET